MGKAVELEKYYRLPADTRDLNYGKFFSEGESKTTKAAEYTSHNTYRLNLEETKKILLKLSFIMKDVLKEEEEPTYEP